MLTPNPFSLFCAILVCFPLALVFTLSSHSSTLSATLALHRPLLTVPLPPPPSPPPPPPPSPPPIQPKIIINPPKDITSDETNTTTPKTPAPSPPPPPPPETNTTTLKRPAPSSPPPLPPETNTTTPERPTPSPPPPPPPEDDKEDVELLKRASRVNPDPEGGPKKVAFLFLTTTPLPFAPLWEMFFNQSTQKDKYNIYIHTDPKLLNYPSYNTTPPFTGVFSGRVIPSSKPTRRNTPTLITAARRLLAHALLDDPNNYMFTLLSGACVPLHSFNFTYNTLTSSNKSFIEILNNETTAYGRWAARGEHVMLPDVPFEDFRIGSQFWSLTRRHARVVVQDVKLWRKFRMPCLTLGACFPEENYFPTLLSMVDTLNVVPATLTNVNWRGSHNGHPRTYNASEVDPGLIRWLREGPPRYGGIKINGSNMSVTRKWDPFLFARKFATNCVEPLLGLANDVLFKD
ncbi:hypothetical protein RND81_08G206600 [Saponaria officinalis]|uniref:Core-2/I-branching beta-1,6-N-acetylglucosaminyltransferase family protein n=1 Tax=Saponaria officinalis TaxID=3572 RepID=A0AAW1JAV2_SAPOF